MPGMKLDDLKRLVDALTPAKLMWLDERGLDSLREVAKGLIEVAAAARIVRNTDEYGDWVALSDALARLDSKLAEVPNDD